MLNKVISDESGRALALTLIMLGIGVLLIPPFLAHISTNLLACHVTEEGLKEQYASDAGVEYALRRIIDGSCPENEPFPLPTLVNRIPVTVTVSVTEVSELDYAIWSGGDIEISVDSLTIGSEEDDHDLHSDSGEIKIGNCESADINGTCEYRTGDPPTCCDDPLHLESSSDPPVEFDIDDYKPGSAAADAAGTLYHCCPEDTGCDCDKYTCLSFCDGGNFDWGGSGDCEIEGLYYVSGDFKLTNVAILSCGPQGSTIVARGTINLSSNHTNLQTSYMDNLLYFANGSEAPAIDVNSFVDYSAEGIFYAPNVSSGDIGIIIQSMEQFYLTGGLVTTGATKMSSIGAVTIMPFPEGQGGYGGCDIYDITSAANGTTTTSRVLLCDDDKMYILSWHIGAE